MAKMSDKEFERQYTAAVKRGKEKLGRNPRAASVHYDAESGRVVIDLTNGCTFIVPTALLQDLAEAKASDLADVRILGPGTALDWPRLDAQFSVTGLVAGVFGTKAWMSELGRAGGSKTSAAKRTAARRNGRLGGRPRKQAATKRKPRGKVA
jgi:hypothetical protein